MAVFKLLKDSLEKRLEGLKRDLDGVTIDTLGKVEPELTRRAMETINQTHLQDMLPPIKAVINQGHSVHLWIRIPKRIYGVSVWVIALKNPAKLENSDDISFYHQFKIKNADDFWKFRKEFIKITQEILKKSQKKREIKLEEVAMLKDKGNDLCLKLFSDKLCEFQNCCSSDKIKWMWIFYEDKDIDPMWEWVYTQLPSDKSGGEDFFWGDHFFIVRKIKEKSQDQSDTKPSIEPTKVLTLDNDSECVDERRFVISKLRKICTEHQEVLFPFKNDIIGDDYDIIHAAISRKFFEHTPNRANSGKIVVFCSGPSIEPLRSNGLTFDLLDKLVLNKKETLARIDTTYRIPNTVSYDFAKCFYDELFRKMFIAGALVNARKKLKGELSLFNIDLRFEKDLRRNSFSNELKNIFKKHGFPISNGVLINSIDETKWLINDMFIAKKCGVNMEIYKKSNNESFYRFAFILQGNPRTHIMGRGSSR